MEDLPEHHSQISHSKHIMTSLWRRQEHASQMTLEFYSHVTDCRQNVSHGFVVVPRPLVLRVALGCFLGGGITCRVLGLSYMDYKVFLQLLSVDIVQFTLAEIRKKLTNDKNEMFIFAQVRDKEKRKILSPRQDLNPWPPGYQLKIYHLSLFYHTMPSTYGKKRVVREDETFKVNLRTKSLCLGLVFPIPEC